MGKFRSKLKGQTKGKRWPKGQSSSSNPVTTKYRDLAKSRFFQENLGPSNLTSDALQKHNAVNSFVAPKLPSEPIEMDMESNSVATFQTLQTFASDWSACTNVSFNRLLSVFQPSSALHKEMLAILAAITEVIKQNGGSETSTEYYAALMTTLEVTETEDSLAAILSLLNMGLKSVPDSVLKLKFAESSKTFIQILNKNIQSDNNVVMKSLLGILSYLLRVQEAATWSNPSVMQVFGPLLAFTCHSKPKIRKAAQQGVCSVLKASHFMTEDSGNNPSHHPAAANVAQFCIQQIEGSASSSGQTTTLHTLTLLKDVIHTFPKAQIKSVCETILKIMTINNPLINSCGMQVLYSLFSAQHATMPASLNGQLISALYDYQPAATDTQPTLAWIAVMQQAHVHLSDVDVAVSCNTLPKIIKTLTQLWLLEEIEVMGATTRALQTLLEDCVAPACATSDTAQQFASNLQKCFNTIELCLGYQYNKAWHQVLHVIAVMFKVAGKHCSHLLSNCLKQLAELRDSYKFSYNDELEYAVGAAVKSMGPDFVLQIISLKKNADEINIDRSWLLPVLKENIHCSTLEYFFKNILPLAMLCQRKSIQFAANNDGIKAHSYELLYIQLWSLLPSFCRYPLDVKTSFKSIAKILGTAIADRKELRSTVMTSLRKLISSAKESENEGEISELARFAKNYLPILFNLYTTKPNGTDEEGLRLAALDTIKIYLSVASAELRAHLFKNALDRLKSEPESTDSFTTQSILDLIRALVPHQDSKSILLLYDQCIKDLVDLKDSKDQKKAYKLLEEICSSEAEGCKEFFTENRKQLQGLLMRSLSTAAVTSKGARLRCLNYLIKAQPQLQHDSKLIKSAAPEAVLCCKDVNEKCRAAAYELLTTIGETLEGHQQMSEYIHILVAGLAGNPQMISCTLLSLASVLHNFSGSLGPDNLKNLLETASQLIKTSIREIVGSCISFLKVYMTSLPSPIIATSLPVIVKSLTSMTEDCKRHFRLKIKHLLDRLIRKYGYESIVRHVPQSDTGMHKRLNNLRKLNARKKRKKEELRKTEEEEAECDQDFTVKAKPRSVEDILADSDSELDAMEVDESRTNKRKVDTWIQEDEDNIVDFTDPSAVSKITATKPGKAPPFAFESQKKKKDRGFKTAPDGRLIIADDSDSDDNTPRKKDRINLNSDSESDDDYKSAAETAILGNKKRKRQDTESMRSGFSSQQPAMKYKAGGSGIHRHIKASAGSVYSNAGSEYKSKKAKGDVKKKGKPDPYAYLPLSRSSLNKRKRKKNSGQFKNIIKAAKSGARKGTKIGKKNRRKNS